MEPIHHKELNRPNGLEKAFRENFYNKKLRVMMDEVELKPFLGYEGIRSGWYDFESNVVRWGLTELSPGLTTPQYQQLCETTIFILEGRGSTIINGHHFEWERGDALFLPLFTWYQHHNIGSTTARYAEMSTAPLFHYLGVYGNQNLEYFHPPKEKSTRDSLGKIIIRAADWIPQKSWGDIGWGKTVVLDFDYRIPTTRGVPSHLEPGTSSIMHRHASEAQIFIYKGRGHSTLNDVRVDWKKGDVVRVPLFAWHQHTNTGDSPAIILKNTSAGIYNRLGMLMRDEKRDFKSGDDISIFKDDFRPF